MSNGNDCVELSEIGGVRGDNFISWPRTNASTSSSSSSSAHADSTGAGEWVFEKPSCSQTYRWTSLTRKIAIVPRDGAHVDNGLRGALNYVDLVALGVSSSVGSGVFVISGAVARNMAGPSVVVSFAIAGIAALLSVFCYAEFSSRFPSTGSAYTFCYASLGEFTAWFVGWNLTFEYAVSASVVARGCTSYSAHFMELIGAPLPPWLVDYPLYGVVRLSPMAGGVIALASLLLLMKLRKTVWINNVIAATKLALIVLVIVVGASRVQPRNWSSASFAPFGAQGVFAGAGQVFFTFVGFDGVSALAGETRRPKRDVPAALIVSLGATTLLHIGVALLLTGMVLFTEIDERAPVSRAFDQVGIAWMSYIVSGTVSATLLSTTLCTLLSQTRIFYQMSADRLFFSIFSARDRRNVPVWNTLFTALLSTAIAVCFDIATLADTISIGTLLAFSAVAAGLLMLRYKQRRTVAIDAPLTYTEKNGRYILLLIYVLASAAFGLIVKWAHVPEYWWLVYAAAAAPLSTMCIVCVMFCRLPRGADRQEKNVFKCPLVPLVPCAALSVNMCLIVQLPFGALIRVGVWTAIGLALYFGYGIRNSLLNLTSTMNR